MTRRLATVFGGSGFIGRHVVEHLARDGWRVRVAVRDTEGAAFLKTCGTVGQIVPLFTDITSAVSVQAAVEEAEVVVNAVGILYEHGRATFRAIHVEGAERVAKACAATGCDRLVHISAIGADARSEAAYARSKAEGEAAVLAALPSAVILRPSVVFGPGDGFFNLFARLAALSPVLPVFVTAPAGGRCGPLPCGAKAFGDGGPKLQPVYVGDVARAVMAAVDGKATPGGVYQLGGPRVMSLKEIIELVLTATGRHRLLVPVPMGLARLQAAFLQYLPKPLLTPDQVRMLAIPNVVAPGAPGLAELGIEPTAAEIVVPTYLGRYV